jgi:hypothetical protein
MDRNDKGRWGITQAFEIVQFITQLLMIPNRHIIEEERGFEIYNPEKPFSSKIIPSQPQIRLCVTSSV